MPPQKTLVIYSGPTSMNRNEDKNGIYHDNMVYFLEHGISCNDDNIPTARGGGGTDKGNDNDVVVKYVFVLTKEVAAITLRQMDRLQKLEKSAKQRSSSRMKKGTIIAVKKVQDYSST
jgi:hypothetical protein